MEIRRMMALSTAHLPDWVCNRYLKGDSVAAFEKGEYGWFVHVPDDMPEDIPHELEAIFNFAKNRGCEWVMFDRDICSIEALPSFKW